MSRIRKGIVTGTDGHFPNFSPWGLYDLSQSSGTPHSLQLSSKCLFSGHNGHFWPFFYQAVKATLNQVDFFLLKRVDYYYREQQIIIRGPNLKQDLLLSKKQTKDTRAIVGRQKSSPRAAGSEWRTKRKTGQCDLFQEAALVCDPYLLCVILIVSSTVRSTARKVTVFKINKLSFSTIFSNKIPATRSSCKNCYPEKVFKDGTRPSAQVM